MAASRRKGFMVDKVAVEHDFSPSTLISPVSTFPPMFHTTFIYMLLLPES
jgi:hypothetical protein